MQPLPGQQTLPGMDPATQDAPQLTYALLQTFERSPGCERYTADSERIKLLCEYIWIRQLTPNLTFEEFLQRYQRVADHNDENRKHPAVALDYNCPRSKAKADRYERPQWSAREVVDILVLYVDMCRAADEAGLEVPMTLDEYLAMDGPAYKRGEISGPDKPERRSNQNGQKTGAKRVGQPAPADPVTGLVPTGNPQRPTQVGQRVIYEPPHQPGRQIKGVVTNVRTEPEGVYISFQSDEGECVQDASVSKFVVCDEAPPPGPDEESVLARKRLWIPKNQFPQTANALSLGSAMGNVQLGVAIYQWEQAFGDNLLASVSVVNAEAGPYVDAELLTTPAGDVLCSLPPRKSLLGEYRFQVDDGVYILEVVTRE